MSRALQTINKLVAFWEAANVTVKLSKKTKGKDFTTRKAVVIPAGTYTRLGPDEEDPAYLVISDPKRKLFLVKKIEAK